jgi:hypothetical protein
MTSSEIVVFCSERGVALWVEGDALCHRGHEGSMSESLKKALLAHKAELTEHLRVEQRRQLWAVQQDGRTESIPSMDELPVDAIAWCRSGDREWTSLGKDASEGKKSDRWCGWFRRRRLVKKQGAWVTSDIIWCAWQRLAAANSWSECRDATFGVIKRKALERLAPPYDPEDRSDDQWFIFEESDRQARSQVAILPEGRHPQDHPPWISAQLFAGSHEHCDLCKQPEEYRKRPADMAHEVATIEPAEPLVSKDASS